MTSLPHPRWCDRTRCKVVDGAGQHESSVIVVSPGNRRTPRFVLLLVAPSAGSPVRLRLVLESDVVVNAVEVDIDTAALVTAHIDHLVAATRPEE